MPKLIFFFTTCFIIPLISLAQRNHETILVDQQGTGSFFFANEFAKRWSSTYSSSILTRVEKVPKKRLDRLAAGQGRFAVIGAKEAFHSLSQYPTLAVVAPLLKTELYILGRANHVLDQAMKVDTIYFHHNTADFFQIRVRFLHQKLNQVIWKPLQPSSLLDVLSRLKEKEIVIFYAPDGILKKFPQLKRVKISTKIAKVYQKHSPWILQQAPKSKNLQKTSVQLFQYSLLVMRKDTSNKQVSQTLKLIYNKQTLQHLLLYQDISLANYKKLLKEYHLHEESKVFFTNWLKA